MYLSFPVPAVDPLCTRPKPAISVQEKPDEVPDTDANSWNVNHRNQPDDDFHVPVTSIDDILSEGTLCNDKNTDTKYPFDFVLNEPAPGCQSQHPVTLPQKASVEIPVESSPTGSSNLDTGNEKGALLAVETTHLNQQKENTSALLNGPSLEISHAGSKCMYPLKDDSDSTTDSSVMVNKMAGSGSLQEEVEFCSCDVQQPDAGGHSDTRQSPNRSSHFQDVSGESTNMGQTFDVSLTNKETTTECSQLSQVLSVFSEKYPCQSYHFPITVSSVECDIDSVLESCDNTEVCGTSSSGSLVPPDTHGVTQEKCVDVARAPRYMAAERALFS